MTGDSATQPQPLGPSSRSQVPPFEVMTILGRVSELRQQGHDVISLCAGEPGGGAPTGVNEAAAAVHTSGRALNYTPALGIPELRSAIAAHYRRWYHMEVTADQVAVTTGSSGAFMVGFLSAFTPGDRVAMARPGYPAYRNILHALGCQVVEIDAGPEVRFQPTPALLEDAERVHGPLAGLVVASPNNPTGTMLSREELAALATWCSERGVRLVSDEIYHGITYADTPEVGDEPGDERGVCAWEYSRESMVISSFSKYWGMPGWRIGWMLMPQDLAESISGLTGSVSLCPPAAAQYAAVEAFTEDSYAQCDVQVAEFARTRHLVLGRAEELGWTGAAPADGAFYYYAQPSAAMLEKYGSSAGYCEALLEQAHVALTPGGDFDSRGGDSFVRLSFAAGYVAVAAAIERILKFQEQ